MFLTPKDGELHVLDDEDVISVYAIDEAEYNWYSDDGVFWLTIFAECLEKLSPDDQNLEPNLELNLFFHTDQKGNVRRGTVLKAPSYDEKFYNLTNMCYGSHDAFECAKITIEDERPGGLLLHIKGECNGGDPVALRSWFSESRDRTRSLD
ncbi:MAG: hypothetical protein ACI8W8_001753 [Rhodothermales bacterium]|jgi:hypothetical protein